MQATPHRVLDAQGAATEMREYEVAGVQAAAVIPHVQSVCDIEQLLDASPESAGRGMRALIIGLCPGRCKCASQVRMPCAQPI